MCLNVCNEKGYHVYQGIWVPKNGETLSTEKEPGNPKDKQAVCVKKNGCMAEHLPLGKTSNFAKTRSSRPEVFCKKGVLRPEACNFIKKETLAQAFFFEFSEIFKNIYFYRTLPVTASRKLSFTF